nr:hypothetical protein [Tanacetum cinerariifolium]
MPETLSPNIPEMKQAIKSQNWTILELQQNIHDHHLQSRNPLPKLTDSLLISMVLLQQDYRTIQVEDT